MRITAASLFLIFATAACGDDSSTGDGSAMECAADEDCGSGVVCIEGVCMPEAPVDSGVMDAGCDPSRRMCGDECVDTRSDTRHCGACDMACSESPGATTTCVSSACVTECDDGFEDCDGDPANGCETDISGDDDNCGACGNSCGGGTCVGSTCLLNPRGDGSAGDFMVSAEAVLNTVVTTANGGAARTEVILGDATGFTAGQLVLLHQTQGPDAGHFELHLIDSVEDGVAMVSPPLTEAFGTGAGSVAQAIVVPQYASLTVTSGGRVIAPTWDGMRGGIVAIAATGAVTIEMGGSIDLIGRGFRPGVNVDTTFSNQPGGQGEGHLGTGMQSASSNGSGGGGGAYGGCNRSSGGGGGAGGEAGGDGVGVCSPPAVGGVVAGGDGSPMLGGGGGTGGPFRRSAGGAGGGVVMIFAESLTVEGTIAAGGTAGAPAQSFFTTCGGGGGGGGGGSIFVDVDSATLGEGLVSAVGGAAGPPSGTSYCAGLIAGGGGAGRISIRATTLTGTTDPPAITP